MKSDLKRYTDILELKLILKLVHMQLGVEASVKLSVKCEEEKKKHETDELRTVLVAEQKYTCTYTCTYTPALVTGSVSYKHLLACYHNSHTDTRR